MHTIYPTSLTMVPRNTVVLYNRLVPRTQLCVDRFLDEAGGKTLHPVKKKKKHPAPPRRESTIDDGRKMLHSSSPKGERRKARTRVSYKQHRRSGEGSKCCVAPDLSYEREGAGDARQRLFAHGILVLFSLSYFLVFAFPLFLHHDRTGVVVTQIQGHVLRGTTVNSTKKSKYIPGRLLCIP